MTKHIDDDFHTPFSLGGHLVPGIWRYMFADDLTFFRFPTEGQSTCNNCPKVKEEGFHPDYRCCTYHPQIPNFLLGLALEDSLTAPLIEKLVTDGLATPEGLYATASQMRNSLVQMTTEGFGKHPSVVCRFLDVENRRCRIYKYRNSVCSTFFCKHDHGDVGVDFWAKLQAVAGQHETALAQWAMSELGINVTSYFGHIDAMAGDIIVCENRLTEGWSAATLKRLWGRWYGREKDFYLACAGLVRKNKSQLVGIVEKVVLQFPKVYDQAFRESLSPLLRAELEANGGGAGEPAAAGDLWYLFGVAHRNLWLP